MNAVRTRMLLVLLAVALFGALLAADDQETPGVAEEQAPLAAGDDQGSPVEDLGNGHYRIGAIEIDKDAQRFTVTGTAIGLADYAPIEFLAVSKGGYKSYEALLELDVSAVEFNLACILIGLDEANASRPKHHFDRNRVTGDVVDVRVSWERDGKLQEFEIERLLKGATEPEDHVWIYTGSYFTPDGAYVAALTGTLIGVVHDPDSIIQHQTGLGLGNFGAVAFDPEVMPPAGTRVTVSVFRNPE